MIAFEPFCELTEAGRHAYQLQWNMWAEEEFHPEFWIYWLLFLFILILCRHPFFQKMDLGRSRFSGIWFSVVPVVLTLGFVLGCTGGYPIFEDEFAYVYQAEALMHGVYPGILPDEAFQDSSRVPNIYSNPDGRLVGLYSIGYPLILGLGAKILGFVGANLLIHFLGMVLLFRFLGKALPRIPWFFWVLCAFSPWLVLFPGRYYSHSLSLLIVCGILLRLQMGRGPGKIEFIMSSALFLIRPLDGLIVLAALLAYGCLSRGWQGFLGVWGFLVFLPLHFLNQKWISGYFFQSTYSIYSRGHFLGFGPQIGIHEPWGFSLQQAFENLFLVLLSMNDVLLGWPQLSLLLVLWGGGLCLSQKFWKDRQSMEVFMALLSVFWFGAYFVYFYPGIAFGPRFHYPLVPVLFYLAGKALSEFECLRLPCLIFGFVGVLSLFSWWSFFRETMSFQRELEAFVRAQGVRQDEVSPLVVNWPELESSKADLSHMRSRLFSPFFARNDVFSQEYLYILKSDYLRNQDYFEKRYPDGLMILELSSGLEKDAEWN